MMILEMQFGGGSSDLEVFYNSNPLELATQFAAKNRLKNSAIEKVASHIQNQIECHLELPQDR